jgi:Spy/CpxP family protein refolding chaperone
MHGESGAQIVDQWEQSGHGLAFTQLYTAHIAPKRSWFKVATMDARLPSSQRKDLPMTDKQTFSASAATSPRSTQRRWALAGLGAASIAAITAIGSGWHATARAHGPGFGGFGHRGWHGSMDPESMGRRLDAMVSFALADTDATPEQKSRIATIAKSAANDLAPMRKLHTEARQKSIALLTAPTIDRAQLEALRVQQMQLGDTVSRRMVQAIADAAEVLTPDQRTKLAQKVRERHGPRG